MPGVVVLSVTEGPLRGRRFEFSERMACLVGRGAECQIQLPESDLTVSRHHCMLEIDPPCVVANDLGSSNGTFLNDKPIEPTGGGRQPSGTVHINFMRHGDHLRIGSTTFLVSVSVPDVCIRCGIDIPDAFKPVCRWGDGNTYLCGECRQRVENEGVTDLPMPCCTRCGKPASDSQLSSVTAGDFICGDCAPDIVGDPWHSLAPKLDDETRESIFTQYDVRDKIGQGAMGAVYFGLRRADQSPVAIKVLLAHQVVSAKARGMFRREVAVARALNHPHVIRVLDSDTVGSAFYLVMEYCAGGTISELMKARGGRLHYTEASLYMAQALDGLACIHESGIVHRDIKPANIMLADANHRVAKIGDFSISKRFFTTPRDLKSLFMSVGGSPCYMPREQVRGYASLTPVSDIWSVGATLYTAITGKYIREFGNEDHLFTVLTAPTIPLERRVPSIPPALAEVVARATAENPSDRFQTAGAFRDALIRAVPEMRPVA